MPGNVIDVSLDIKCVFVSQPAMWACNGNEDTVITGFTTTIMVDNSHYSFTTTIMVDMSHHMFYYNVLVHQV